MIPDLKEFEKLLKLCRKQGVTKITVDGICVELGDLPEKQRKENEAEEQDAPEGPTLEQLMDWNSKQ